MWSPSLLSRKRFIFVYWPTTPTASSFNGSLFDVSYSASSAIPRSGSSSLGNPSIYVRTMSMFNASPWHLTPMLLTTTRTKDVIIRFSSHFLSCSSLLYCFFSAFLGFKISVGLLAICTFLLAIYAIKYEAISLNINRIYLCSPKSPLN